MSTVRVTLSNHMQKSSLAALAHALFGTSDSGVAGATTDKQLTGEQLELMFPFDVTRLTGRDDVVGAVVEGVPVNVVSDKLPRFGPACPTNNPMHGYAAPMTGVATGADSIPEHRAAYENSGIAMPAPCSVAGAKRMEG